MSAGHEFNGKRKMSNASTRLVLAALIAVAIGATATGASAQGRSVVNLIVPQAPGGVVDIVARSIGDYMQQRGTANIVVNKPGAAGEIAATFVTSEPANGMTLLVGNSSTMVVAPQVKKTRYDPDRDLRPLGGIIIADTILVTNISTGLKSLDEVVAYAKANPGKLAYSSNGVGGAFHLAMEYLQSLTGTKLLHVPFNGAAPAELALLTNEVGVMVANTSSTLPHIKSGKLVALAVVGSRPSHDLPNLAAGSSVVPNFVANTWVGAYARAGIAEERAVELNRILEQYLKDPNTEGFLRKRGLIPVATNLQGAAEWQRKEMEIWGAIVAAARKNGPIE